MSRTTAQAPTGGRAPTLVSPHVVVDPQKGGGTSCAV